MSIPASVLLYANWLSANLSGTTYTTVSPEKPVGYTYTFNANNTIVSSGGTPWLASQEIVDLDNNASCSIVGTTTSSHIQVTQGRIMCEFAPSSVSSIDMLRIEAATPGNGRLLLTINSSGELVFSAFWNSGNDSSINLGAESSNPYAVEIIYDTNNGTRANRIKARMWDLGGTPPSFTDNSGDIFSAAGTTDQFTSFRIDAGGTLATGLKAGRVAVSNDIAEDLSALDEGGAAGVRGRALLMGVG